MGLDSQEMKYYSTSHQEEITRCFPSPSLAIFYYTHGGRYGGGGKSKRAIN